MQRSMLVPSAVKTVSFKIPAAKVPSDFATLAGLSPEQHTYKAAGNLNWRMADYIGDMIKESLAGR